MTYTILSAKYANAESTAAVIRTVEARDVLIGQSDTPDLWAAMLAWGAPDTYTAPPPSLEPTKAELLAQLAALTAKVESLP